MEEEVSTTKKKLNQCAYEVRYLDGRESEVWKIFGIIVDPVTSEEKGFVECKFCKSLLRYQAHKAGTSQLKRHKCATARGQVGDIKSFFRPDKKKLPISVKDEMTEKCLEMCVKDIRPFATVSGEGFKSVAQALIRVGSIYGNADVDDILPDPTTLSRRVIDSARRQREKVLPEVQDAMKDGLCSATTDMWTDDYKKISYITLTVHYAAENWLLKKRVLFTSSFPRERKTGENIRKELLSLFANFGFDLDLFKNLIFVTDQGANIINALQPYKRLNCCAHMLNTVLRHTFEPAFLIEEVAETHETFIACKELVTYMKQSGNVSKFPKTLHQEVETRWNTKLKMLLSIYEQYDEIAIVLREINESYRLSKIHRHVLQNIVEMLQPFKEASDALEADKTPTIQAALLWFHRLLKHCSSDFSIATSDILKLKERAKSLLRTKFKIDMLHKVATFLWPTFRQLRMLSREEANEVKSYVRDNLISRKDSNMVCVAQPPAKKSKNNFSDWEDISVEEESFDELAHYMVLPYDENNTDLLSWWMQNTSQCPQLAEVAKRVLSIPATSASSERNFSTAGRLIEERRTNLKPEVIDSILFLHDNLPK